MDQRGQKKNLGEALAGVGGSGVQGTTWEAEGPGEVQP